MIWLRNKKFGGLSLDGFSLDLAHLIAMPYMCTLYLNAAFSSPD